MNRSATHSATNALTADDLAATRRYAMVIEWSEEDQAFVVTMPDIRGLRTHGATRDEAARMGEEATATWLASDAHWGVESPTPRFTALDDTIYAWGLEKASA
jgi:predicted RNase H-like HicB family nuclease